MPQIHLVFSESLRLFLNEHRQGHCVYGYQRPPSIKDVIESRGVPHVELRLILRDGRPVDLGHPIQANSRYHIYSPEDHPPFEPEQLLPLLPPGGPRFVLDVHLGILARSLRMLGFDALYDAVDKGDEELARISATEQRIMLSRDIGLLKRGCLVYGYFVRARSPEKQLREVVTHYNLVDGFLPFTRCMNCNDNLRPVEKAQILHYLPERVKQVYNEFVFCGRCDQCFWKGSHYQRMQQIVEDL